MTSSLRPLPAENSLGLAGDAMAAFPPAQAEHVGDYCGRDTMEDVFVDERPTLDRGHPTDALTRM